MGKKGFDKIMFTTPILLLILRLGAPFSFDFTKLELDLDYVTLWWNQPSACSGNVSYTIYRAASGIISISDGHNCSIQDNFININKSMVQISDHDRYKFYVEACCDDMQLLIQQSIQTPLEVTTKKMEVIPESDVCIQPGSQAFTVIWPKSNISSEACICSPWIQISRCSCIQDENFFAIYNNGTLQNPQLCWRNLKYSIRVHFAEESLNPLDPVNPLPLPLINSDILESYYLNVISVPIFFTSEKISISTRNAITSVSPITTSPINYNVIIVLSLALFIFIFCTAIAFTIFILRRVIKSWKSMGTQQLITETTV